MLAMGVDKIDVLVLSHPHADHVGGFVTVADNFEIGQVYVNGHEYDSGTYRAMMEKIEELSLPCEVLEAGDAFSLGEKSSPGVVRLRGYGGGGRRLSGRQ